MAQMVIYLDDKTRDAVKRVADAENRSMSNMVRIWIEQGLRTLESQSPKTPLKPPPQRR